MKKACQRSLSGIEGQWVPREVEAVHSWPTVGLKSRSKFKSCAARRKDVKGKGNGKGPIHRPVVSNPGSVCVVPASEAEDSAASFQAPSEFSNHHHMQPMRQAKLLRIPIVDSNIEHQLVLPQGSSNSSNSSSSRSSSSSDNGSSSSLENDDSDDEDVYNKCRRVTFFFFIS